MSRKTQKVLLTHSVDRIIELSCDICARKADRPDALGEGQWEARSSFDVSEVSISLREGSALPEGRSVTETSFDVCPDCFHKHIEPLFRVPPRVHET